MSPEGGSSCAGGGAAHRRADASGACCDGAACAGGVTGGGFRGPGTRGSMGRGRRSIRLHATLTLLVAFIWSAGAWTHRGGVASLRSEILRAEPPGSRNSLGHGGPRALLRPAFVPGLPVGASAPWTAASCPRRPALQSSIGPRVACARSQVMGIRMSDADTDKSVAENSGGSERNQTAGKILGGVIGKMAASSWKAAQTGKTFRLKFPEGAEASGSKLASSWNGMLAGASGAVSGASGAVRNRTLEAAGAGARAAAGAGERVSKADLTAARSYAANVSSSFISFTRGGANRKVAVKSQDELEAALREGISVHRMDIRGRSQPWRQSEVPLDLNPKT